MGCCRYLDEQSITIFFFTGSKILRAQKITTVVIVIIITSRVSAEEVKSKMKNKQKTGKQRTPQKPSLKNGEGEMEGSGQFTFYLGQQILGNSTVTVNKKWIRTRHCASQGCKKNWRKIKTSLIVRHIYIYVTQADLTYHRITEWPSLEGTSEYHLVQLLHIYVYVDKRCLWKLASMHMKPNKFKHLALYTSHVTYNTYTCMCIHTYICMHILM